MQYNGVAFDAPLVRSLVSYGSGCSLSSRLPSECGEHGVSLFTARARARDCSFSCLFICMNVRCCTCLAWSSNSLRIPSAGVWWCVYLISVVLRTGLVSSLIDCNDQDTSAVVKMSHSLQAGPGMSVDNTCSPSTANADYSHGTSTSVRCGRCIALEWSWKWRLAVCWWVRCVRCHWAHGYVEQHFSIECRRALLLLEQFKSFWWGSNS